MFVLDAPYVSDFLRQTIDDLHLPVLDTEAARRLMHGASVHYINRKELAPRLDAGERVLTNSENALSLVLESAPDSDLARQVEICKDKGLFRETIAPLHPGYAFVRCSAEQLHTLDISKMPCPFVVKPARGFFSLGIHVVSCDADWQAILTGIDDERDAMNAEYPAAVVDGGSFVLEQAIEGEEYALDVYYDAEGEPVILDIMHHHFLSADDISDRLYTTSSETLRQWLAPFTEYTAKLGEVCEYRSFPLHLEVRVTPSGEIIPIEANPLRFAGWCVADITHHAWGFNPYEYYMNDIRPDWETILAEHENEICAMVIGDVPPNIDRRRIAAVDYDGFSALFETVLELRKIDHTAYPVFAFAYIRMKADRLEPLKQALTADFSRFITME